MDGKQGAVPAALAASAIGLDISGAEQMFNVVIVVVLASLTIVGFSGRKIAELTLPASPLQKNQE